MHRDIKPSNVLVWLLHPIQGVDVKLADYGVSQFYSPSGLRRHKGTEEYMAPELFHDKRRLAYDEKVGHFITSDPPLTPPLPSPFRWTCFPLA